MHLKIDFTDGTHKIVSGNNQTLDKIALICEKVAKARGKQVAGHSVIYHNPKYASKSTHGRYVQHKINLWLESPNCHWCNLPTVLVCNILKAELPDNAATIDHEFCHGDLRRSYNAKSSLTDTVLSCYLCNHERSLIQDKLARKLIGRLCADQLLIQVGIKNGQIETRGTKSGSCSY